MSRTSTTVTRTTTRPTLAEMKAALANSAPTPVTPSDEPLGVLVGRKAADIPKFFDACITSYRFYRKQ